MDNLMNQYISLVEKTNVVNAKAKDVKALEDFESAHPEVVEEAHAKIEGEPK